MDKVKSIITRWLDEDRIVPLDAHTDHKLSEQPKGYNALLLNDINKSVAKYDSDGLSAYAIAELLSLPLDEIVERRSLLKSAALKELKFEKSKPYLEKQYLRFNPNPKPLPDELSRIQACIIAMFHRQAIRLTHNLFVTFANFPIHSRGGILDPLCLKMLPYKYSQAFQRKIDNFPVELVYFSNVILTLPYDMFCISKSKKSKSMSTNVL